MAQRGSAGAVVSLALASGGLVAAPVFVLQRVGLSYQPSAGSSLRGAIADSTATAGETLVGGAPAKGLSAIGAASLLLASGQVARSAKKSKNKKVDRIMKNYEEMEAPEAKAPSWTIAAQIGVSPFGVFDPIGFIEDGNPRAEGTFKRFREAELKHGRVAMLASVGLLAQHFIKFPGFDKVPEGVMAPYSAPGSYGMAALVIVSGAMELLVWTQDPKKEPGNFGDPLGVNMYNEDMRNKEVNNGRMAMISVMGIFMASVVTGQEAVDQLGAIKLPF
jgi:light-harvesting complex I chlorophyll a/b binding protein 1